MTSKADNKDDATTPGPPAGDQQHAREEKTDTQPVVSPIADERPIGSFEFLRGNSLVKARTATVLITARGHYLVYTPDNPPNAGDLIRKRVKWLSEVDMGHHQARIRGDLPCQGDAFGFRATVDLHWRVRDPATVVRDGVRDVRAALEPPILGRLRPITREYTVEDSEGAERAANDALRRMPEVDAFGFDAVAFVRLGMDDAVRDRVRMKTRVDAYRSIIAAGDLSQFALRLAENPKDVAEVISLLIQERDSHRSDTVDFVTKLIDSGAIERWEIDDQIRTVLQWLRDTTNRVITGTDEARHSSLGTDQLTDGAAPRYNGAGMP
jgi:hypothetical protein